MAFRAQCASFCSLRRSLTGQSVLLLRCNRTQFAQFSMDVGDFGRRPLSYASHCCSQGRMRLFRWYAVVLCRGFAIFCKNLRQMNRWYGALSLPVSRITCKEPDLLHWSRHFSPISCGSNQRIYAFGGVLRGKSQNRDASVAAGVLFRPLFIGTAWNVFSALCRFYSLCCAVRRLRRRLSSLPAASCWRAV